MVLAAVFKKASGSSLRVIIIGIDGGEAPDFWARL
jgi:hypothetical protein